MFFSVVIGQWSTTRIKKKNKTKKKTVSLGVISEVVSTRGSAARLPHTAAEVGWYFFGNAL